MREWQEVQEVLRKERALRVWSAASGGLRGLLRRCEYSLSKVSRIVNGRLDGFSQDRLMRYLRVLGDDVEITIRRPRRYGNRGDLTVKVESAD